MNSVGYVQGIRHFQFVVGKAENGEFMKEQLGLMKDEEPHYQQMPKSIGLDTPIYLWYMASVEPGTLITDFEIGQSNASHSDYKDFSEEGYRAIKHEFMDGHAQ